jgi:hypothetical protein
LDRVSASSRNIAGKIRDRASVSIFLQRGPLKLSTAIFPTPPKTGEKWRILSMGPPLKLGLPGPESPFEVKLFLRNPQKIPRLSTRCPRKKTGSGQDRQAEDDEAKNRAMPKGKNDMRRSFAPPGWPPGDARSGAVAIK